MGIFDDALPGGSIAKPVMVALGALLVGKMMGSFGQPAATGGQQPGGAQQSGAGGLGGLLQGIGGAGGALGGALGGGLGGGLGGLLASLTSAGHGEAANSWVGAGPNTPIQPPQLGAALGQTTVADLARASGMSEQELLAQLSRVLPGVVDKLTPDGKIPDQNEILSHFR